MKKIYIVLMMVFLSAGAFAQITSEQTPKLRKPISVPYLPYNTASRDFNAPVYLDYDSADAYIFGVTQSEFIWNFNKYYKATQGDTAWGTCVVKFDTLFDLNPINGIPYTTINSDQVTSITVDSIYTFLGQVNNSGIPDTLIVKILGLDNIPNHYPNTSSILWADTNVISTSISASGNWLQTVGLQWDPALTLGANVSGFAVQIDYYDATKIDTCGFIAGFNDQGACGMSSQSATAGNFYPNSYASWTEFPQFPLIPTVGDTDLYYDCNGNHKDDAGDGANYMQDIRIGAWITVTYNALGLHEDLQNTGIGLYQNIPNPLHNSTDIRYQLANNASNVMLYVYDMVGKQIMQVEEGDKTSGSHIIHLDASSLAKGMYTYTLRTDASQLTKRMIVE